EDKAVYCEDSKQCLYFFRTSLPFVRDNESSCQWCQHIGVYSYKAEGLERFSKLPESELEYLERLEQLRALENQMNIGAIISTQKLVGVDVQEDIKKVEEVLSEQK